MLYKPYNYLNDGIVEDNEGTGWDGVAECTIKKMVLLVYGYTGITICVYVSYNQKKKRKEISKQEPTTSRYIIY
jgi:hypothetical protein